MPGCGKIITYYTVRTWFLVTCLAKISQLGPLYRFQIFCTILRVTITELQYITKVRKKKDNKLHKSTKVKYAQ